ncbi:MAG: serine hydrolase [Patescibacteria group bacterium]
MLENLILSGAFLLNNNIVDNFIGKNINDNSYFHNKNIIEFKQGDINKKDYFSSTKINKNSLGMSVSLKSGIMFDYDTGEIIWAKNENEKRTIASLTKIMTILVFLENDYDTSKYLKIEKSDIDLENGAAALGLRVGDEIKVNDLLIASLVGSKNDAINALVRSTGLTDDEYVKKMNEKAKFFDLKNTYFDNINGLSNYNKSTAKDLSKLFYYAFLNKDIKKISTIKKYTFISKSGNVYNVKSTDRLLDSGLFDVLAGKTGYLDDAQYCLSVLTKNGNKKILGVFLGSDSDSQRFYDAKVLNWWAYENFKN